jgi:2'-5' RNA ligase
MRSFIAVEIPEEISDYLKELQKEIDEKATFPKHFHLTLKFLGEVKEKEAEQIKEDLKNIKFKPFELSLNKLGFFPDDKKIRVVWIGFKDNRDLIDLQNQVHKQTIDYKQDHPFSPHLTLARIKFVKDREEFLKKLRSLEIKEMKFNVDRFKLIKSELTPEGPVYEILEEFGE